MNKKKNEDSNFIPYLKMKKKLFKSKLDYALRTKHEYYFTKKEVKEYKNKKSPKPILTQDEVYVDCGCPNITPKLDMKQWKYLLIKVEDNSCKQTLTKM